MRPAVSTPRKGIVAVLADFDASLIVLLQFLPHVVQKRRRNAEWDRIRRGRHHFIDGIVRLLNALDDQTVLVVGMLK